MAVVTLGAWPLLRLSNVHAGPLPTWWVIPLQLVFFILLDDFPWSPSHLIPFSDGATHHDFHHAKVKGNYAGFFPWTDAAFGTLCAGYAEHLERRKKVKAAA